MKKAIIIGALLFIAFALTYCGDTKKEETPETPKSELREAPSEAAQPAEETAETQEAFAEKETATEEQKTPQVQAAADYTKTPLKGTIVNFSDIVMGGSGKIKKNKAIKKAARGNPILLKTGEGKIYFVYNPDGSFAGKKLAKLASDKKVAIYGKTKKLGNLNIIIAGKIEPLD